uniref:Uncharacterized protein n=1 Tax=Cannabis sativa TaxID=3483 RepID=A0A803QNC8_CANSA
MNKKPDNQNDIVWLPTLALSDISLRRSLILLTASSFFSWVNATKFLTGASSVGSIAIPAILKHAGVIGWGAMAMEFSSFFIFVLAIMCYIRMNDEDSYYSAI